MWRLHRWGSTLQVLLATAARVWITERAQSLRMLAGHHSDVSTVLWHPNGDLLASGSDDRTIRLWDVRDGRPRRILVGHGCAVSLQT